MTCAPSSSARESNTGFLHHSIRILALPEDLHNLQPVAGETNLESRLRSIHYQVVQVKLESALERVATKLFWWKPPEETLSQPIRFAAQVMTLGTWNDVQVVRAQLGDDLLRRVLMEAPPGVFDEASWTYWHNVFGIRPVPELPKRKLC